MRLTHFFINRPRFAAVLSMFVTLLGLGALAILPVPQYPEVVPPTVQVTTTYPGASAETVARTGRDTARAGNQRCREYARLEQSVAGVSRLTIRERLQLCLPRIIRLKENTPELGYWGAMEQKTGIRNPGQTEE